MIYSGDRVVTLPGQMIAEGVRAQASAGVLMWTELDDLVIDGESIAAGGSMLNLHLAEGRLHSTPVGMFLRFSGGLMTSEVVFMGKSEEAIDVSAEVMPSVDRLRERLASKR